MPEEESQKIDIGDLTQNVTAAVHRALEKRTEAIHGVRMIIGVIVEPIPKPGPTPKPQ